MTVKAADRKTVYERDPECVARGTLPGRCSGSRTLQHIVNRGMGGSHAFDRPAWLISMCAYHNDLIERHGGALRSARMSGYHVARGIAQQMSGALVLYPDGNWYILDNEGGRNSWTHALSGPTASSRS